MKKKNSIHIPQWVIYTVIAFSGVVIIAGVFSPENFVSIVSNRIAAISGAASILLALLAIVLTLRLEETDETIAVLKHNVNEQKTIYLNRYEKAFFELSLEVSVLSDLFFEEKVKVVSLQEIKEPVEKISIIINKLWQLPVINMTENFEDAFSVFNAQLFMLTFFINTDYYSNPKEAFDEFYNSYQTLEKCVLENKEAYKKTFL